jgi:WD40 repeat protein
MPMITSVLWIAVSGNGLCILAVISRAVPHAAHPKVIFIADKEAALSIKEFDESYRLFNDEIQRRIDLRKQGIDRDQGPPFLGSREARFSATFSPDSRYLASCSGDETVCLWQIDGGACRVSRGHTDLVFAARPEGNNDSGSTGNNYLCDGPAAAGFSDPR